VVEGRAGADQFAHDVGVSEMCGGDQRGSVVAAGGVGGPVARRKRNLERGPVVGNRREQAIAAGSPLRRGRPLGGCAVADSERGREIGDAEGGKSRGEGNAGAFEGRRRA
jgi:hypothetical protein